MGARKGAITMCASALCTSIIPIAFVRIHPPLTFRSLDPLLQSFCSRFIDMCALAYLMRQE